MTIVTEPASEPVTLAEAKTHIRVDTADDDTYINTLITAARRYTEDVTGRALIEQTWDMWLDRFPVDEIIVVPPLISVTTIKYTDEAGTVNTWGAANYTVDTDNYVGRIYPVYNGEWPTDVRDYPKAVEIRVVVGYANSAASPIDLADNIPQELKHAILFLIGHWYEHRETELVGTSITDIPMTYRALIDPYRVFNY